MFCETGNFRAALKNDLWNRGSKVCLKVFCDLQGRRPYSDPRRHSMFFLFFENILSIFNIRLTTASLVEWLLLKPNWWGGSRLFLFAKLMIRSKITRCRWKFVTKDLNIFSCSVFHAELKSENSFCIYLITKKVHTKLLFQLITFFCNVKSQ